MSRTLFPCHVAVRISAETLARVDALAPSVNLPGHRTTRADVLRHLVELGLQDLASGRAKLPQVVTPKGRGRRALVV